MQRSEAGILSWIRRRVCSIRSSHSGPICAHTASSSTEPRTTLSGVGNDTWKRTPAGLTPLLLSSRNVAYEAMAWSSSLVGSTSSREYFFALLSADGWPSQRGCMISIGSVGCCRAIDLERFPVSLSEIWGRRCGRAVVNQSDAEATGLLPVSRTLDGLVKLVTSLST